MWEGVGQCTEKNLLPWKLATIPLYNPLKSPMAAHVCTCTVHKTTYGPLIDTAINVLLLMKANPLLGQVGGGWALEI